MKHETSRQEITALLDVAARDLDQCNAAGLGPDWQLTIAYNAALQAATAALAACGYRAARDAHHYRIIQSLAHTIGLETDVVNRFDTFRKKRNVGSYEAAGRISQQEADEMKKLAKDLNERVLQRLHRNHADLMAGK